VPLATRFGMGFAHGQGLSLLLDLDRMMLHQKLRDSGSWIIEVLNSVLEPCSSRKATEHNPTSIRGFQAHYPSAV
jgi:hypothetical protein